MNRRVLPAIALLAVLTLGVAGCSSDEPSSADPTTASTSAAAGSETDGGSATDGPDTTGGSGSADPETDPDEGPTSETPDAAEPTDSSAESAQPSKKGKQTAIFGRVPGNKSGSCVRTAGRRDVRSGGFVGGPFDTAAATWNKKQPGKPRRTARLYWVPMHAKTMPGVHVTATHRSSGETVEVTKKPHGDAEQWKFYDTYLKLPNPGTWELRVSAGPDEGCFLLALPG